MSKSDSPRRVRVVLVERPPLSLSESRRKRILEATAKAMLRSEDHTVGAPVFLSSIAPPKPSIKEVQVIESELVNRTVASALEEQNAEFDQKQSETVVRHAARSKLSGLKQFILAGWYWTVRALIDSTKSD